MIATNYVRLQHRLVDILMNYRMCENLSSDGGRGFPLLWRVVGGGEGDSGGGGAGGGRGIVGRGSVGGGGGVGDERGASGRVEDWLLVEFITSAAWRGVVGGGDVSSVKGVVGGVYLCGGGGVGGRVSVDDSVSLELCVVTAPRVSPLLILRSRRISASLSPQQRSTRFHFGSVN